MDTQPLSETNTSRIPPNLKTSSQLLTAFSSLESDKTTVHFPDFLHNLTLFKGTTLNQDELAKTIATLRTKRIKYYTDAYANTTRGTKGMAILTML
jgi:hypothetical protein